MRQHHLTVADPRLGPTALVGDERPLRMLLREPAVPLVREPTRKGPMDPDTQHVMQVRVGTSHSHIHSPWTAGARARTPAIRSGGFAVRCLCLGRIRFRCLQLCLCGLLRLRLCRFLRGASCSRLCHLGILHILSHHGHCIICCCRDCSCSGGRNRSSSFLGLCACSFSGLLSISCSVLGRALAVLDCTFNLLDACCFGLLQVRCHPLRQIRGHAGHFRITNRS
mmetsp:Transcript_4418/g.7313  ORF Transcript_4418/g.7313 Transcript_4418/m.7313 type:complete len:224 (+) Transcript_4418:924-1595(+)